VYTQSSHPSPLHEEQVLGVAIFISFLHFFVAGLEDGGTIRTDTTTAGPRSASSGDGQ
jgi:hypothetical protein